MSQAPELRRARPNDADFAWRLYAEAVEPHVGPYIASRFQREWREDEERSRFDTWWTPENTSIISIADQQIGWFHVEETEDEIILANYCIASDYRRRGIGSKVLRLLLDSWSAARKPVTHSVLKTCPHHEFFKRHGFHVIGEDELAILMKRPVPA
jgi:N-acetylglutamate synthase-like GNAT family acetyltransferase